MTVNISGSKLAKVTLTCNTGLGTGGQGVCLANAAAGFSEIADLTVFCADLSAPQTNFRVYPVGYSRWSRRLLATPVLRRRHDLAVLLSDLYFDQQVSKKLKSQPCDLIMGVAGQTNLGFKTAKAQGAIAWLYCLNNYLPFMQKQIQQEIKFLADSTVATMNPMMLQRFREECTQADLIIVLSNVAKQTFIDAGIPAEKIKIIPPFIDTERFYPVPKADSIFRPLYVGTIEPRKGVQYLIPAFLKAKIPNSELLLIGGASTRILRLLVEDTITNYPNIKQEFWNFSQQEPVQVFSRCSVLVLPSVEDGFGLVALEAMACGLPVIVTAHCGAADLVQDGINGFVIPPRDEKAIAEKLDFLAANESIRREMGQAARNTAITYTQEFYKKRLQETFSNS